MHPDQIQLEIAATVLAAQGASATDEFSVADVERLLFGELADPMYRQAIEHRASQTRQALLAGATEAALYQPGRIPEVHDEVIFAGAPASILKVHQPGSPVSAVDLLQYRAGQPQAFAVVQHDLAHGWSWLGEPPPPAPTAADRVRAAIAAGKDVPAVGEIVRLICRKPRSYLGVELIALRARVVAQVDVLERRNHLGDPIVLDLEVVDELVEGLDPARASGTVRGVVGPVDRDEGWGRVPAVLAPIRPDRRSDGTRPCDRCGQPMLAVERVLFSATDYGKREEGTFAVHCRPCAERFSRLAFERPPEPTVAASPLISQPETES